MAHTAFLSCDYNEFFPQLQERLPELLEEGNHDPVAVSLKQALIDEVLEGPAVSIFYRLHSVKVVPFMGIDSDAHNAYQECLRIMKVFWDQHHPVQTRAPTTTEDGNKRNSQFRSLLINKSKECVRTHTGAGQPGSKG